jgi:hypothetical protein
VLSLEINLVFPPTHLLFSIYYTDEIWEEQKSGHEPPIARRVIWIHLGNIRMRQTFRLFWLVSLLSKRFILSKRVQLLSAKHLPCPYFHHLLIFYCLSVFFSYAQYSFSNISNTDESAVCQLCLWKVVLFWWIGARQQTASNTTWVYTNNWNKQNGDAYSVT